MKALKFGLCFFILLSLTACTDGKLKNLTSFIDSYNHFAEEKLTIENFFFQNGSEDTLRAIIGTEEYKFILSLKEDKNSKIKSVKLSMPKTDNAHLKIETTEAFCRVLSHALMAYCSYNQSQANEVADAFALHNPETLYKQGELTMKKGNFYFVYYSDETSSEVMIYNTYLHTIEPTEKPVSRPYYGENFIEKD